ncbi:hypothetical protein Tco_1235369 [Tanacetum coccineum]
MAIEGIASKAYFPLTLKMDIVPNAISLVPSVNFTTPKDKSLVILDIFKKASLLTTSRLIDGSPCSKIDMVIKDLDLEPNIDAMMRKFLNPSRWKELSKKTSSKILPGGDGSCRKTFKPIASLIAKGKLK